MAEVHITARALSALLGRWRTDDAAYRSLADRIRLLILDGRIPADTRLPAERDLAERLDVSRTTVTAAYRELRDSDFLESTRGSGSVAQLPGARPGPGPTAGSGYLDFSKAALPAVDQITGAAQRAAARLTHYLDDFDYDTMGLPELRAAIADRYIDAGLPTSPDEIMVTLGAQHAIGLIARTHLSRGDRAVIEHPTYPHAHDALRIAGARLVPVAVTAADGWDTDELEQAIDRSSPTIAYLMPDFHNPTGATMTTDARRRVCRAAARQGTVLVIDETTAELDIDSGIPFLPFAASDDAGAKILTVGSFGKTVWGGIRLGWIRAERGVIRKLVSARTASDLGTPILEQLTALELLPEMPEILLARRHQLGATRDRVEQLLAERLPQWEVPHVSGGLAAWVGLGAPVSSQLALAARSQGLLIAAGPRFGIDGAFERFLRIPITYPVADTELAIDALASAWRSIMRAPVPDSALLAGVV
ncbi:DNA-binding transcriptional MocR family regulator [Mycetocola sp. CAN_C7]|uniref:MocR-like transcription factor YczR n=1 Tax=Mycetocola sp. CAN_C7 TaxID=2787724 RepID=UPI0018CB31B9